MKKILLIEDDSYIRKMVANRLETEGYKVLSADGPLEAIDYCDSEHGNIGLVILDIMMPDENMFDAHLADLSNGKRTGLFLKSAMEEAFAKHSEEFPYLIVLTGYYNKEDMKVIEEMAHEVIHKPTDEDAIVKAVKNWLPLRPS